VTPFAFFIYVVLVDLLQILKCISQLELAQLIGTFVRTRYITGPGNQTSAGHPIEAFDPEGKICWKFWIAV
jgi:hypothetical protein